MSQTSGEFKETRTAFHYRSLLLTSFDIYDTIDFICTLVRSCEYDIYRKSGILMQREEPSFDDFSRLLLLEMYVSHDEKRYRRRGHNIYRYNSAEGIVETVREPVMNGPYASETTE